MNILIKLTSIVALIIAPHISDAPHERAEKVQLSKPTVEAAVKTH
jgi:hypothetical protein